MEIAGRPGGTDAAGQVETGSGSVYSHADARVL